MFTPGQGSSVSRRAILAAGSAAGAGLVLAGCQPGAPSPGASGGPVTLTLQTWASAAEKKGFEDLIAAYKVKHPNVTIELVVVPAAAANEKLQTGLAAGTAPDLARIAYQNLGRYSGAGALVDITKYLPQGFGDAFTPGFWSAVSGTGKIIGVPHHTGAFVVYYNKKIFEAAGITTFPTSADKAWTWEEFLAIAAKVIGVGTAKYAITPPWTNAASAYRWMWFLYMHGGQLLSDDLKSPMIDSPKGIETIRFTQDLYTRSVVPPNMSIKTSEAPQQLFSTGTVAMMIAAQSQLPFLKQYMKDPWAITFLPRDVNPVGDLAGTAMTVTKDSKHPEVAADFLQFITTPEQMGNFCVTNGFLPTRKDLVEKGLTYTENAELIPTFIEQSKHVPKQMAAEQTMATFDSVNTVLADQLEAAFKTGQSAEDTARNISDGIKKILK